MRDGSALRVVKRLALWCFVVNTGAYRAWRRWRGERTHRLAGSCRLTGRCCEAPAIRVNALVWYMPSLRRMFLGWQKHVNGFILTGVDRRSRTFIFRCEHFDAATRRCDSYESRPGICRDYPRVHLGQPNPEFLPGCGYRAVIDNADALRQAIRDLGLSPDREQKLLRGLNIDT
ncbi:MAG: YkgJ family cysteine cluster protein [Vicinamibacteria bacterium]|nr:YkgJ family cysteine cluster protein [Vicinamibacteria bacterium]